MSLKDQIVVKDVIIILEILLSPTLLSTVRRCAVHFRCTWRPWDRLPSSSIAYIKYRNRISCNRCRYRDNKHRALRTDLLLIQLDQARRYGHDKACTTNYQEFLGKSPLTQNWYQMSIIHLTPRLEIRSSAKNVRYYIDKLLILESK